MYSHQMSGSEATRKIVEKQKHFNIKFLNPVFVCFGEEEEGNLGEKKQLPNNRNRNW